MSKASTVHCGDGGNAIDLAGLAALLKKLGPRQEKVTRLYYGLGCERPHAAEEMAEEFGVSPEAIGTFLDAAQKRLAGEGWSSQDLREPAREEESASRSGAA